MQHGVSAAVARYLKPTVGVRGGVPPSLAAQSSSLLPLVDGQLFAQDGAVDPRDVRFKRYEVPDRRKDYGLQPSASSIKSLLSLATWNVGGEHFIVRQPRFIALCAQLRENPPTVLCLHDVRREHEAWLRAEPRLQYAYAMSSLAQWDRDVAADGVSENGGTIVCVDKRVLGLGSRVRFASFAGMTDEGRGLAVIDLATKGVPQVRIATAHFETATTPEAHACRGQQYGAALELLTHLDATEAPVPTVFLGDLGGFASSAQLSPFFSTPLKLVDAVAQLHPTEEAQRDRATYNVTYPWRPVPPSRHTQGDGDALPPVVLRRQQAIRPDVVLVSSPHPDRPTQLEIKRDELLGSERVVGGQEVKMIKAGASAMDIGLAHARLKNRLGRDGFVYPSKHLGVIVHTRLVYRPDSPELATYDRLQAGVAALEADRDVPNVVKEAAGRVKGLMAAAGAAHRASGDFGRPGRPYAKREGGRPVPRLPEERIGRRREERRTSRPQRTDRLRMGKGK